ncbi:MAG: DUF2231 domain-containing protein [Deltaproteobacteria bacterium]|nr:MAG: DUF2231 domain-containing protein [Deltaproteobacteria bacterium]
MLETLLPGAQRLQNLHPLLVHFPLALLPASALLYVLAWLAGRDSWAWTGLWLLVLGALSAAAAAATGLHADEGVMVDPSVREQLLDPHRRLMLTTVGLSIALAAWAAAARPLPARGRVVFLILLVVLLALMSRGADYGGRMVYDYNAGGNACPQPIEFTR